MKRLIKVPKIVFIAGAVTMLVSVESSVLRAQADTGSLRMQEQRSSVDKKKKQDRKAAPVKRSASASDYGRIGSNPNRGSEVSPKCEDAYALAAQIAAGGPVDRQVSSRNFGNMDASQGLPTAPFQPRMAPRDSSFKSSARHGRSEINKSLNSMRPSSNGMPRMPGC